MLYVVGIGSGNKDNMSFACYDAIKKSDVIVGYDKYISQIQYMIQDKQIYQSPMMKEIERSKKAIEYAKEGNTVSVICSGDSGIYAMAGLIMELAEDDIEIKVIPGITSAILASSLLGAPIMHDYCSISLSDLMTPLELIFKRIELASMGDFVIAIYNPKSKKRSEHLKESVDIMLRYKSKDTVVGVVKKAYDVEQEVNICTLESINYDDIDMHTILIIGNSSTYVKNGKMITPRGYEKKYIDKMNS
ncbi:precorrin-3B C(17)-methyltransferase [Peptoanaerobacter stomatis]